MGVGACILFSADLPCVCDLALLVSAAKCLSARLGHTWVKHITEQSSGIMICLLVLPEP